MSKNKNREKVMVCVTRQRSCERLIKNGAGMAEQLKLGLLVAHAVAPNEPVLGNPDPGNALETLFQTASQYGGEMTVLRDSDTFEALVQCALESNVSLMILGASPKNADSVLNLLKQKLPKMSFIVVEAESELEDLIA